MKSFHLNMVQLQVIQRADYRLLINLSHMCVYHCSADIGMPEEFLYSPDVIFVMQIAYAIYTPTLRDSQTAQLGRHHHVSIGGSCSLFANCDRGGSTTLRNKEENMQQEIKTSFFGWPPFLHELRT